MSDYKISETTLFSIAVDELDEDFENLEGDKVP